MSKSQQYQQEQHRRSHHTAHSAQHRHCSSLGVRQRTCGEFLFQFQSDSQEEHRQQTILHPVSQSHIDIGVGNGDAEILQLFERMRRERQIGKQQTCEGEAKHNQTRYAVGSGYVSYFLVRMRKVPWLAVAIVGILAWVMMFEAGVHPTLAGVLVGLLTPAHERFGEKTPRAERYADKLQPFSALLALPIFALFATGVHFESLTLALFISPVVVAVMVALVVGKPLGIMITAWLSTHVAGLKMAKGLRVRDMFPAACACGIGFTVSFLISSLAYQDAELSAEARFGVLVGSIVAAVISGILLSRQSKKFELAAAASSKHKHHTADELSLIHHRRVRRPTLWWLWASAVP